MQGIILNRCWPPFSKNPLSRKFKLFYPTTTLIEGETLHRISIFLYLSLCPFDDCDFFFQNREHSPEIETFFFRIGSMLPKLKSYFSVSGAGSRNWNSLFQFREHAHQIEMLFFSLGTRLPKLKLYFSVSRAASRN